jgi:hypothetical protein
MVVLPPPWPNFLWMFVCIWVKFWFHHFTSHQLVPALCHTRKNRMFWIDSWKMQQDSSFAIRNHFNNQ